MKGLNLSFIFLVIACNVKKESDLSGFFKDFERKIHSSELLNLFADSEVDVFLLNNDLTYELFAPHLSEAARKNKDLIETFLERRGLEEDMEEAKIFLILLFRSYLNKTDYDESEYLHQAQRIVEKRKLYKHYSNEYHEYLIDNIVNEYTSTYAVGDTISLIFPLDYNKPYDEYSIYSNAFPQSLDFSNAADTLFLTGSLIEIQQSKELRSSVTYKMHILDNSHPDVRVFDKKYKVNDIFRIDIRDYARPPYN